MTLNQIAELIAERDGRQFDVPFKKEIEDMVVYWRAILITRSLEKKINLKNHYRQAILVELEEVGKEECEGLGACGCENVLRTKYKIPDVIKVGPNPFDYVGGPGGSQAYSWTTFGAEAFMPYSKYTGKLPRYTLVNNYIYLFADRNSEKLRIEDVWSDPRNLANFTCPGTDNIPCYSATSEFPADVALVQIIVKGILEGELRKPALEEKVEIKADKNV